MSAVTLGGLLAAPAQAAAAKGKTELITKGAGGLAPTGPGAEPSITPNGRYVAFQSTATNLLPKTDSLAHSDIFVRDTKTGKTRKVSTGLKGAEANGGSSSPDITPDGRYVVFMSAASNLVKNDPDPSTLAYEVFHKDLKTGKTTRVTTVKRGPNEHGSEYHPAVSADGQVVVFYSNRADLIKGDTNAVNDVFVWKRATKKITRISVTSTGKQAGAAGAPYDYYAGSRDAQISADGKTVVFRSGASNLVKGDTNDVSDVFTHSLTTHRTTRISVGPNGSQATGGIPSVHEGAGEPTVSDDGKLVVYSAISLKGLVAEDTGNIRQAYLYNRVTRKTQLAVRTADGGVPGTSGAPGAHVNGATISPDGRFVVFETSGPDLVKGADAGNDTDVFVRDLKAGRNERISVGLKGGEPDKDSGGLNSVVSSGGTKVVFSSDATNLVPDPVFGRDDLYLRQLPKKFWGK
ncbi:hypothetical protein [Kineosporia sp. NBRC 101677]|uniref:TolB family protein n=1 Tax=Kineosporia sp. NBRC 101677 TaxID=3032197 RepID=UPI0025564E3F|nr:hypothetical protein [Kineosporia sp. NBRC 101677]